ncbi:hypothetical protein TUBRATIS_14370 [Tubulinosema ratisbonensis]|uniref:Uncharacterized protein n=1 Tax=Tubulinosema ratisbonensis TaxID=291195 RepID=A0A437ALQ6_9MICR|nr:hypothetical protein TUBRATIS_14370 [Tubulinosema ratisbonensis]
MEFKLLSLFFIFIFSSSENLDKAGLEKLKKETKKNIKEIIKNKDLKTLFESMKGGKKSVEYITKHLLEPDKLRIEGIIFQTAEFKKALKTLNSHFKKNNPNDPFYKEFKNNIELLLSYFLHSSSSSYWIYAVYVGIFLGGVGISYTILYFLKKS